jgi:hypothetical protein
MDLQRLRSELNHVKLPISSSSNLSVLLWKELLNLSLLSQNPTSITYEYSVTQVREKRFQIALAAGPKMIVPGHQN